MQEGAGGSLTREEQEASLTREEQRGHRDDVNSREDTGMTLTAGRTYPVYIQQGGPTRCTYSRRDIAVRYNSRRDITVRYNSRRDLPGVQPAGGTYPVYNQQEGHPTV